jgi:hypothetical protein
VPRIRSGQLPSGLENFAWNDDRNDLSSMSERRYNEEEVAAIFERAAEAQAQQTSPSQLRSGAGMTLTDLQEIGREVGISREQLAEAAKAIELGGRQTSREFLGLPVGVGLTLDLGRKLSDDEWERFVADLRETFDARGTLRSEGSLRQWANGNLHAYLEPSVTGHRIRLRTVKGDARGMIVGGLAMTGFAVVSMISAAVQGALGDAGFLTSMAMLATGGTAMFGVGALRLPRWARLRRRQMEAVAARVAVVASSQPALERPNNEGMLGPTR